MQFQEKCLDRMREVVEEGTTVIFVSHNLQAVQTLCEQTLLLKTGTVSTIGPTAKVLTGYLCEPSAGASSFPTLIEDISLQDVDGLLRQELITQVSRKHDQRYRLHL
jgi:lipopolysaccharide transport system ATP-binding protein